MAEIINLRRRRKARERGDREIEAAANRALHGRSKEERLRLESEAERDRRRLDGAQLEGLRLDERSPGKEPAPSDAHDERD